MLIETFATFALDSGVVLRDVPVAYRTWGRLNEAGTNAVVVCHALTGDAEADVWWGPMIGPGRTLDTERYFVVCANVLASPYGTAAPVTTNPATGRPYGIAFPRTTIRDTVRLHRRLLGRLGVQGVASAVGGSMGGMQALEWALLFPDLVQSVVAVAVGGRHTAWQIGISEAQRQAIYADPRWQGGRYAPADPPADGLAAARMMAMVTYRSHAAFDERFGRARMPSGDGAAPEAGDAGDDAPPPFAVESYLRYQGAKLAKRFDAACYVRLTEQMDTHDLARGRGAYPDVLRTLRQPTLVLGIDSDVLYPLPEQEELARHLPHATFGTIHSPDGHDAFLIAFEAMADRMAPWLAQHAAVGELEA